MPEYVVTRVAKALNERGTFEGRKIDARNCLQRRYRRHERIACIESFGTPEKNLAHVSVVDPYIPEFIWKGQAFRTVNLTEDLIREL